MSALLSVCCCDDTATCCSCSLASSYSVAVSLGWTVDGLDSTGSAVQTTTVGAGFSALTVSEASPLCVFGTYPSLTGSSYAATRYDLPTAASASFVTSSDGDCPSRSAGSEAGTWDSGYTGLGDGRGLTCWHEVNPSSPAVNYHFWTIGAYYESTATCTVGFNTYPLWAWSFLLYSSPQTACHAPTSASNWSAEAPVSGTAAADSRLISFLIANNNNAAYCNTTATNRCRITSGASPVWQTESVTIT